MPRGKTKEAEDVLESFVLADDYKEEYEEAKVTLVEEEKEFDLGRSEALAAPANAKPYSRKRQFKSVGEAEEILPTSHQPGLLIRRVKRG
jgi:hypothetical protein